MMMESRGRLRIHPVQSCKSCLIFFVGVREWQNHREGREGLLSVVLALHEHILSSPYSNCFLNESS